MQLTVQSVVEACMFVQSALGFTPFSITRVIDYLMAKSVLQMILMKGILKNKAVMKAFLNHIL